MKLLVGLVIASTEFGIILSQLEAWAFVIYCGAW